MLQRKGGLEFEEVVKWSASGDVETPSEDGDRAREEVEAPAEGD